MSDRVKFLRRRHRRINRIVCLVFGHRYVFGVKSVPNTELWDCRWCPKTEIRGDLS